MAFLERMVLRMLQTCRGGNEVIELKLDFDLTRGWVAASRAAFRNFAELSQSHLDEKPPFRTSGAFLLQLAISRRCTSNLPVAIFTLPQLSRPSGTYPLPTPDSFLS